jgi:hypothetical protein
VRTKLDCAVAVSITAATDPLLALDKAFSVTIS